MTLVEDKVARHYIIQAVKEKMPDFAKPGLLYGLPVALLASVFLYRYDIEQPYSWVIALIVVPASIVMMNGLPYMFYLFTDRWILGEDYLTFRGSVYGRLRITEQGTWNITRIDNLPGYYWLSLRRKNTRSSIILAEESFPIMTIRSFLRNNYGGRVGDGDTEETV